MAKAACTVPVSSVSQFTPLSELASKPYLAVVNVIGTIISVGDIKKTVRVVTIRDVSLHQVRVTLTFANAINFAGKVGDTLALKLCVVNQEKQLATSTKSSYLVTVSQ